jgi:hypothetical protein
VSDSIVLNGPNGSSINVASFLLADPGADFGETDLQKAAFSENPAMEGAALAFESVGKRSMTFPVRIASIGAFGGAAGVQAWLRTLARPGATLDVQLDGVASVDAMRFDVYSGRFEVAQWNTQQYAQTDRFEGALRLDCSPYAYLPTMILLASAASVGGPGVLALDTSKIIGDVPGLAEVFIAPTSATAYGRNTQQTDAAFWSFSARPSFQAFWPAGSAIPTDVQFVFPGTQTCPTLVGDLYAPASQALRFIVSTPSRAGRPAGPAYGNVGAASMFAIANWVVPPSLEPAYRGRHRIYAWMRLDTPTVVPNNPLLISADVVSGTYVGFGFDGPLASAMPLATLPMSAASLAVAMGTPAYHLLDLGEVSLPPVASQAIEARIRLWAAPIASAYATTATAAAFVGGVYLLPLDQAGVAPRGLAASSTDHLTGRLFLSAVSRETTQDRETSTIASRVPDTNIGAAYRGVLPFVGASTLQLDLNLAGRDTFSLPTSLPPLRSEPHFAQVSVRYRPRFTFMKGL